MSEKLVHGLIKLEDALDTINRVWQTALGADDSSRTEKEYQLIDYVMNDSDANDEYFFKKSFDEEGWFGQGKLEDTFGSYFAQSLGISYFGEKKKMTLVKANFAKPHETISKAMKQAVEGLHEIVGECKKNKELSSNLTSFQSKHFPFNPFTQPHYGIEKFEKIMKRWVNAYDKEFKKAKVNWLKK